MASTSQSPGDELNKPTLFWSRKWSYTTMSFEIAIVASIMSGILGLVGAVSNGVVMYIITQVRKHHDRKNVDILILSLCLSDFLSSVVVQPLLIAQIVTPRSIITFEQLLLLQISSHCTILSGSLGLFTVTLERFISIRFPYHYTAHDTKVSMYISLTVIWVITFGFAVWVILDGEGESKGLPIEVGVVFFLTLLLQIMIFRIIQNQNRKMRRQIMAVQHNQSSKDISHLTRRMNAKRSKHNRTILYLCIVFIATWLPTILFRMYYAISGNGSLFLKWITIFRIVIQLHSCINPYIYSLRTERIKRALFRRFGH